MAVPIVACCDLRFAGADASFTTSFSRRGLIAEWGSSWILPRLIGPAHALDLLFSARKIDAAEAERIGLINLVMPTAELLPFVRQYIDTLAANCSPTSMMIMKREVYQHLTADARRRRKGSRPAHARQFPAAPISAKGVTAFSKNAHRLFQRV